jgi:glyoxylase-like metal-dependent hydrolase (beta-lactamase superfamily II)
MTNLDFFNALLICAEHREGGMEIIQNIHQIPGVIANCYLIAEPEGLNLIDAGLPGSGKTILNFIRSLGRSPSDLRRILITHADMDHVGGLAALKKATGATIFASTVDSRAMGEGRSSRPGQILPVAGELRAVETIGHTPGHFSYYVPALRILFTGDSIVTDDKGLHGSRPALTWDAAKAAESVRRQAALGARIVCPGHGPVIMDAAGKFPA